MVDRDVTTGVDLDPGTVEIEAVRVGHRTDRQHGVRGAHDTAVVTAHDDGVALVVALDRHGPRPLEQAHAAGEEVRLEHGCDLRVLLRQHLLTRHDERHVGTERGEHVHELDAGHAGSDDRHAAWELLGRIAVAGREDAVTVGLAPVRDARPRAGGDEGDVEVDPFRTVDGVDLDGVG